MIIDFQFPVSVDNAANGPPDAGTQPNITVPTTLPYAEATPRALRAGYVGEGGPATLVLWALVEPPTFPRNELDPDPRQWVTIEALPLEGTSPAGEFNVQFPSIRDGKFYLQWSVTLTGSETGTVLATALT